MPANSAPFVEIDCVENAVGHTPLLTAAVHGHIEAVLALLDMGASPRHVAFTLDAVAAVAAVRCCC